MKVASRAPSRTLPSVLESPDLTGMQQDFTDALPRIEGLASAYLGFQRDKEEAVAETIALTWKAYRELAMEGRDVTQLLGKIVLFSAKRVRCGRGLTNPNPAREVLSERARFRHSYRVCSLPITEAGPATAELRHAMSHEVSSADEAAFRIDLEEWLRGLDDRKRPVARQLAAGLNTVEIGQVRGVTRGCISNIRRELIAEWERFSGS